MLQVLKGMIVREIQEHKVAFVYAPFFVSFSGGQESYVEEVTFEFFVLSFFRKVLAGAAKPPQNLPLNSHP